MELFLKNIQSLVDQIEENLEFEVNILDLARTFEISPFHFQRLFKAYVGDSLGRYIRGRKLTRAADLLLNTEDGLIDIALAVGFNSHEAFSRSFKAYFNKTPKDFRSEKPQIVLRKKPVLTPELFDYLNSGITREPRILKLDEQIVVGMKKRVQSPFILEERFCEEADVTWMELASRFTEIKNAVPGVFFGITASDSGDFTEEEMDFYAGLLVTGMSDLPDGMSRYVLPAGLYAQFEQYEPKEDRYKETIDYAYGYWFQKSEYVRGRGVDYVFVEGMYEFGKPGSVKYMIPVEKK